MENIDLSPALNKVPVLRVCPLLLQMKSKPTATVRSSNRNPVQQNKVHKELQSQNTEEDGWDTGDWGSLDEPPLTSSVHTKEEPQIKKNTDDGWGEDEWGSGEWEQNKLSKVELAKKKREERRLRLQAQKEKRAAGGKGPMKLGAVKMQ